jgi:uncharacterized protein YecE (DUF72 family)
VQDDLFGGPPQPELKKAKASAKAKAESADHNPVQACEPAESIRSLAQQLPLNLRLGTSSWHFPGWRGLVWADDYPEAVLSKHGLHAYGQHPLLRTVSLDRSFYRPLTAGQYAAYAEQVARAHTDNGGFRFIVKAPASVCDATIRDENGRASQPNPRFLNPEFAWKEALEPAARGLGECLGALVFQISPTPRIFEESPSIPLDLLHSLLSFLNDRENEWRPLAPHAFIAVEVRDAWWVQADHSGPAFARILKSHGAAYCLGVHAKMPSIEGQLPMLRALWPSPLVARWNLHSKHGKFGYQAAKDAYEPFDRLVDPDEETRAVLARVMAATAKAGKPVLVSINNKAEGSAPLSVLALAQAVVEATKA